LPDFPLITLILIWRYRVRRSLRLSFEVGTLSFLGFVLSQRLQDCVREFSHAKIEVRLVSCLLARCWYQPRRKRLVALESETRHVTDETMKRACGYRKLQPYIFVIFI